jgi:bacterioferritin-associated ferredoxin
MELDDELCLCFHVTKRKVVNYLRVQRPQRASQLGDCYGAGTGCGWCRSMLERLFRQQNAASTDADPSWVEYRAARAEYIRQGHGTPPPGATPP